VQPLRRILGLGFGLAMVFGGTVGVGILRLPGTLAAALGDSHLIVLFWILGGVYALLGAVSVSELAAMLPQAGGFYVYARRAFGNGAGFVVGWSDWFNQVASLAYAAITAAAFLGAFWPPSAQYARASAILIIGSFTALHWVGLRLGSSLTRLISLAVGLMMLILVVSCFLTPAAASSRPPPMTAASLPLLSMAMVAALVTAFRSVLVTYDGWYSPIYLSEESTDPTRTLPRAMIGGTVVLMVLYVLINIAMLRVLPLSVLASSPLPAADAARVVLPRGGSELVTAISLLTVLSLVNAVLLMTPRVLLAIGRDGLFTEKATAVSAGGTPRVALAVSSAAGIALILSGTFEQIVALSSVLFLFSYIAIYIAVFVLRRREPDLPRPYRAWGYPIGTGIVCAGCILVLLAAAWEDPRSAITAALLLAACAPAYASIAWCKRRREAKVLSA
jgi:APA family basic amino acid/polyamine antiporter